MRFFDAHAHMQLASYREDREEVIKRALSENVWMMNASIDINSSRAAVALTHEHPEGVYAAVGLHPEHTNPSTYFDHKSLEDTPENHALVEHGQIFDHDAYKELAEDPKVLAIGECGLDFYRMDEAEKAEKQKNQYEMFIRHMQLAKEVDKPLMIHCRYGSTELLDLLKAHRDLLRSEDPGILHFYTDSKDDAKELLDLGFSFSIGGVITFARDYDEMIRMLPNDRVMSETDAPYVAPKLWRGKRNEPSYITQTVKTLAELRGIGFEQMAETIWQNSKRVLQISEQ